MPSELHCSGQSEHDFAEHVKPVAPVMQKTRLAPMNLASTGLESKTKAVKKVATKKKIRAVWFMMNSFRLSPACRWGKDLLSDGIDNLPNTCENGA
ncbi:hypothetical protein [Methylomonas rapida]|uniref:Uncharacterized protein n=1 Tax=Methylomonas rapida TaxID=2963939 RepID=A0ABY7GCN4_9GAMM|nr:hypothetical protein [Methylomonas rapida]WAR43044.1 hypothetical protein NM686_011595 [Methylomonas rapida]